MLDRVLVPLKSGSPEQVASTIKRLLTAGVQKIKYDVSKTYLTVLRELAPEEVSTPIEKILYQVFGAVEAFEAVLGETSITDLLVKIDQQNLRPSYILCHSKAKLLSVLEIKGSMQRTLFGIPVYVNEEVEPDTFLIFLTKERDCQPEDTVGVYMVRYDNR